jgi:hypothetical protein
LDCFLERLEKRKTKSTRLLRSLIVGVRDGYFKLENTIDPQERSVKRFRHARSIQLYHSPQIEPERAADQLKAFLMAQKIKHAVWFLVDSGLTLIAVLLTPILMPLPGPNVFFYYPLLRTLSHYRSFQSARHGLRLTGTECSGLAVLASLEELLQTPPAHRDEEQLEIIARNLQLEGLPTFLKRYV